MYLETAPAARLRRWLFPPRDGREELIDRFDHPAEAFAKSFRDIRRINRYLGGTAVVRRHLAESLRPGDGAILLDVATGIADIPHALMSWASRRDVRLRFLALDANPHALAAADRHPQVQLLLGDGARLPLPDDSVDFALCSLAFHHFNDDFAVRLLREMHRVARRGVIVNDLRRGRLPAFLIWIVTRATGMHPLTRHDAPLSVLRSRTLSEYRELAERAGFAEAVVRAHPYFRAALVVRK